MLSLREGPAPRYLHEGRESGTEEARLDAVPAVLGAVPTVPLVAASP